MIPARFQPILEELAPLAARFGDAGFRLYLVGGSVRDLMVGDGNDFDLDLTTDEAEAVKRDRGGDAAVAGAVTAATAASTREGSASTKVTRSTPWERQRSNAIAFPILPTPRTAIRIVAPVVSGQRSVLTPGL